MSLRRISINLSRLTRDWSASQKHVWLAKIITKAATGGILRYVDDSRTPETRRREASAGFSPQAGKLGPFNGWNALEVEQV